MGQAGGNQCDGKFYLRHAPSHIPSRTHVINAFLHVRAPSDIGRDHCSRGHGSPSMFSQQRCCGLEISLTLRSSSGRS